MKLGLILLSSNSHVPVVWHPVFGARYRPSFRHGGGAVKWRRTGAVFRAAG